MKKIWYDVCNDYSLAKIGPELPKYEKAALKGMHLMDYVNGFFVYGETEEEGPLFAYGPAGHDGDYLEGYE